MSMKKSNDFPACSAVPQPTAPPAACPHIIHSVVKRTFLIQFFPKHGINVLLKCDAIV